MNSMIYYAIIFSIGTSTLALFEFILFFIANRNVDKKRAPSFPQDGSGTNNFSGIIASMSGVGTTIKTKIEWLWRL
jgi:hypothetical protein